MILDTLKNADSYKLGERFAKAFAWLRNGGAEKLAAGTYEIDGRTVYAMVQHNQLKAEEAAAWECHRLYADIQYVLEGVERMGWAALPAKPEGSYDEAKDFMKLASCDGSYFQVHAGEFAIFLPTDAHRPGLKTNPGGSAAENVKKVVVKVRLD